MSVWQAFVLGILQGLTEFLPVSSSGHLVLFQKIFNISEGVFEFDILVHFATAIAVIWVFRKDIYLILSDLISALKNLRSGKTHKSLNEGTKLALLVIVGSIPTFLIAIVFKGYFKEVFESGRLLGIGFIITGLLLWYSQNSAKNNKDIMSTKFSDCTYIGIMQGIAILPGISRSGSTITGAMFRGLERDFAAKYSFLLSLPVILGAGAIEMLDFTVRGVDTPSIAIVPLVVGFVAALVSGYLAVKFMLKIISKGQFRYFSYYVLLLGVMVLIDQLFLNKLFIPLF